MKVYQNDSDKELISKLQANEFQAFDILFHKYSERLYHFAFSFLKNDEDSKEIVQEVFYRIWKKREDLDSGKSFKSFLFKISYNLIVDQLRLKLKDNEYRKFLMEYFDANSSTQIEPGSDYDVLKKQIDTAINELPDKRKRIFKLSRENGWSHKEIAEELGISVKTVENQITLSIKHIKENLGKSAFPVLLFLSLFFTIR